VTVAASAASPAASAANIASPSASLSLTKKAPALVSSVHAALMQPPPTGWRSRTWNRSPTVSRRVSTMASQGSMAAAPGGPQRPGWLPIVERGTQPVKPSRGLC
jgi:hypothetical protein